MPKGWFLVFCLKMNAYNFIFRKLIFPNYLLKAGEIKAFKLRVFGSIW